MPTIRAFAIVLTVTIACATPAVAQGTDTAKLSVAVGVGRVDPLPVDLPNTGPSWSASVQVAAAKHLIIEGAVTGWRHRTSSPIDIEPGGGVTLTLHGTFEGHQSKTSVSLNALASGTIGRFRFTSGAGAGRAVFRTEDSRVITECVSSDPRFCNQGAAVVTRAWLFSMQVILGVDVTMTSRLRASLTYRLSQPFTTELGDASVLGGLTIRLR